MDLVKVMEFAYWGHRDHKRKLSQEDYIVHPAEVVALLSCFLGDIADYYSVDPTLVLAVGWCHDLKEMTKIPDSTYVALGGDQGFDFLVGIDGLTDQPGMSRVERVADSCARLVKVSGWLQCIKCADIISNARTLSRDDKESTKFWHVWSNEKLQQLGVMKNAHPQLWAMAHKAVI